MRKRMLKPMRLVRYADGLLPAAWLVGSIFAPHEKLLVVAGWFMVRLFGLFSADGVRMAYATQPSMRDVKGSTTLALLLQIAGGAVAGLVFQAHDPVVWAIFGMATLLNIEHVFYEYLYAAGDRYSAVLCRILTAAFMLAWLLTRTDIWIGLGAAGLSALISLIIAVANGGYRPAGFKFGVFKAAPRAMIYGALYPVSAVLAHHFMGYEFSLTAFCAGLILFELCRTPFRRSALESRMMNWLLLAAFLLSAAGCFACLYFSFAPYMPFPLTIGIAALCAFVLWGGVRVGRDA